MAGKEWLFKEGESGNPVGRPKGSCNKTTAEIREALQLIYSKNLERLQADLDSMTGFQRQQILSRLVDKILPNLQKNEMTGETSQAIKISVEWVGEKKVEDKPNELDFESGLNVPLALPEPPLELSF